MAINASELTGMFYSINNAVSVINTLQRGFGYLASAFTALLILSLPLHAQGWKWPEKPENIQVLSKELTGERLGFPMRGFTRALGVRCSYCHVGEEGKPLSTYDFPSDENPNKDRAREMLRMVSSINGHLDKIEPSGDQRVNMWCHTCHRGLSRPISLREKLGETYRAEGLEASLIQYSVLKAKYYGKGAYQFRENVLNNLGYEELEKENPEGAVRVFTLNSEEYPKSWNVWDSLADGYMQSGDKKKAKKYYRKSLKLNPDNRNAKNMLEKLEEAE